MRMSIRIPVLLVIMAAWLAAAPKAVIFNFATQNMDATELNILSDAMRDEISMDGTMDVVPRSKIVEKLASLAPKDKEEALKVANDLGADLAIMVKMNTVSEQIFVTIEKLAVPSGEAKYHERLALPRSEDMNVLIKRIASAIIQETSFKKTATTETILEEETRASRRKGGNLHIIGRVGFMIPIGKSFRIWKSDWQEVYDSVNGYWTSDHVYTEEDPPGQIFGLEGGFAYDTNKLMFEANMGFEPGYTLHFSISGAYFFLPSDFTPYAGGGAGVILVNRAEMDIFNSDSEDKEEGSDGMFLFGRVGMMFLRNYSFKVFMELVPLVVMNKQTDVGLRFVIGSMMF